FAPMQKFSVGKNRYIKDRGYAFEKKLSDNTRGLLNIQLKDIAADETAARVPMIIFNSVIKRDGRKLLISTQPLSFMMKSRYFHADTSVSADAVDFGAMFKNQDPMNLRVLTAMRMNATFPYVLPNVWLPSQPVIDVMDAGLRDNLGAETSLRFIDNFREWIKENTGGVVLLQLRDRVNEDWLMNQQKQSLTDMVVTPATMLQHNWFSLQNYFQADQFSYFNNNHDSLLKRISIVYKPARIEKGAALNFHLSAREKRDIMSSFYSDANAAAVNSMLALLK
ncbi:MAG: patatin-like phospholipase family protein, partial [Gloeobacteraceae cyanobacterium ES-bin-316]|nr:patatin-like phospholipase family protein [Ferruginibacter sp.]